jgi:hypothetical protein
MWKKSSMAKGAARAGKASRTPNAMQARRAPTGVVQGSLTTGEYLLGMALPPRDGLATQRFAEFLPLSPPVHRAMPAELLNCRRQIRTTLW